MWISSYGNALTPSRCKEDDLLSSVSKQLTCRQAAYQSRQQIHSRVDSTRDKRNRIGEQYRLYLMSTDHTLVRLTYENLSRQQHDVDYQVDIDSRRHRSRKGFFFALQMTFWQQRS